MAGVSLGAAARAGSVGNPLGRLARAQYAALARMRLSLMLNGLRSSEGAFETGARWTGVATYCLFGFAIGVGAGWEAYRVIQRGTWEVLPVEFWFVCVLWQTVAVALAAFQEQHDLGGLLRFPVNFGSYFVLCLMTSLLDASTLLGVLGSVGILVGATLARPGLFGWSVVAVTAFIAFNLLLMRAMLAWLERWLAQRRVREIAGGLLLAAVVGLQLLNPALMPMTCSRADALSRVPTGSQMLRLEPWASGVGQVQAWLPPGLEAVALEQAGKRHQGRAAQTLGMLGFYVLLAGGVLAVRLRADYRGENLSAAAARREEYLPVRRARRWGPPGVTGAVWAKELAALPRSMSQMYVLAVPLAMVFVIAALLGLEGGLGGFALPLCLAYALMGFAQLMYNTLGVEGQGVQVVLLAPVRLRAVMAAKNAFHAALFVVVALAASVLALARLEDPGGAMAAATAAWVVFALGANLAAGNLVSVLLAYAVEPKKLGRSPGAQANGLVSMATGGTVMLAGFAVMLLAWSAERMWLATPVLLGMAACAWAAWWYGLTRIDQLVRARQSMLLERLTRTD